MFEETVKTQPIILQYGIAEKSYFDMTEEERKQAADFVLSEATKANTSFSSIDDVREKYRQMRKND